MRSHALFLLVAATAAATPSPSPHLPVSHRLELTLEGSTLRGHWALPLASLERTMGLDGDLDGTITDVEVQDRQRSIANLALAHIEVRAGGASCEVTAEELTPADGLAVLRLRVDCPAPPEQLVVSNELWLDALPDLRSELVVASRGARHAHVFTRTRRRADLELGGWPGVAAARGYLKLGLAASAHLALCVLAGLLGAGVAAAARPGSALALTGVAALVAGTFTTSRLGSEGRPEELLLGALLVLAARLLHARRDQAFELGAVLVGGMALGAQAVASLARVGLPVHAAPAVLGYLVGVTGPLLVVGSLGAALGRGLAAAPRRRAALAGAGVLAALLLLFL